MDVEKALPTLGRICHAVYVPYEPASNPDRLALGIASLFSHPVRVFSVESDVLTPEEGEALVEALTHFSAVIVFGPSNSKLIQGLGHSWPDYFEYSSHWHGSIIHNVNLTPTNDKTRLASVYLLIPALTDAHRSDRPGVFHPTAQDLSTLAARAKYFKIESLGQMAADFTTTMSMRDLCLLHERDSPGPEHKYRQFPEIVSGSMDLSWSDLQTVLQMRPEHWLLEQLRQRLTSDQYAYGLSAIEFIRSRQSDTMHGVFPDIYSAVWFMEHVFQPGTFFRGQFRAEWGLESTLLRAPKTGKALDVAELMRRIDLTEDFISSVRQRETEWFGAKIDEQSLLAVAQHFGFPTPLLDFTESFRIAAFFATLGLEQLEDGDSAIGVIFFHSSSPDKQLTVTDQPHGYRLIDLAGIRVGSVTLIRPSLPDSDDRIRRQQGIFIGGYHAHDLQGVSIDRIYFWQQADLTFQDPRRGVSRARLLPSNTALSSLAEEVKSRTPSTLPAVSPLLSNTPIGNSNIIGSAGVHLYWHLHFGQRFLTDLKRRADQIGAGTLSLAIEATIKQYFSLAHVEAGISAIPDPQQTGTRVAPIQNAIAALEAAAGLSADEIWRLLKDQLPKGFESGGRIQFTLPENWSLSAHLAFGCAMFCVAWEHLRTVPGLRAQEIVQSAMMQLPSS